MGDVGNPVDAPLRAGGGAPPGAAPAERVAWTWRGEVAGSVADLGVLVPVAVALVVGNGLSPTAVLLPAGLAYLVVAGVYRVPVAVQPLKAFGAAAIAAGVGADVVAAGALLMGAVFVVLGRTGLLDRVARVFPPAVIRGVQLAVGLTFLKIAWGLVTHPPAAFVHQLSGVLPTAAVCLGVVAVLAWRRSLVLGVVLLGAGVAVALVGGMPAWGPSALALPRLDGASFATAAVLLVLPQLPLTFANSCLAPADAARTYFGARGSRVTPSRLATTLGAANLLAGAVSGMPVCHGAGGMSAHHAFGARTGRAPAVVGTALVVLALACGAGLVGVLAAFPVGVLAALLVLAAAAHLRLLRDVRGPGAWAVVVLVGVLGVAANLAWGVLAGLALHGALVATRRAREGRA